MNPFFHTVFSISDSLKTVLKSVLIYETIIELMKNSRFFQMKLLSGKRKIILRY